MRTINTLVDMMLRPTSDLSKDIKIFIVHMTEKKNNKHHTSNCKMDSSCGKKTTKIENPKKPCEEP